MAVSEENRALAHYLRDVIGGTPKVQTHRDEAERTSIDIFEVQNAPSGGITTGATLGLSDVDLTLSVDGRPLRVELVFAAPTQLAFGMEILATCAFNVMKDGAPCSPGAVHPRVIELYDPALTMQHILLVSPFLWSLATQSFDSKIVTWLQAIPISESERIFVAQRGADALEALFETNNIDVFNLDRPSVI